MTNTSEISRIDSLNQGWNSELEKLIIDIEDKSWAYTWMHNTSVNYLSRWNDRLSIATLASNILTGTSTFATLNTCSTLLWVQITTGLVIYVGAFIVGYQKYHRLEERVEKHKQAASKYSALYHSIQAQIGLHKYERQIAKEFITYATDQYDNLLLSSPDVDDKILKMYFKLYKGEKRAQPVIYNYNQGPIIPIKDYKGNTSRIKITKRRSRSTPYPNKNGNEGNEDIVAEKKGNNDKIIKNDDNEKNTGVIAVQITSSADIGNEEKSSSVDMTQVIDTKTDDIELKKDKEVAKEKIRKTKPVIKEEAKIKAKIRRYSLLPRAVIDEKRDKSMKIPVNSVVESNRPPNESPRDFKELKSQLLNRNNYANYFHQYDDKLMKYQLERMDSLNRVDVVRHRHREI